MDKKITSVIKIDTERFDKMISSELTKDNEYNEHILRLKNHIDDELINSLVLRVSEVVYSKGIKDGMDFIIERKKIDLF